MLGSGVGGQAWPQWSEFSDKDFGQDEVEEGGRWGGVYVVLLRMRIRFWRSLGKFSNSV